MQDPDQCKLFVGGVSWETTEEALKQHFGLFGNVERCVIAKDRVTGTPRGFAFVSFSHPSGVDAALNQTSHDILGRTVEVKKAIPRSEQNHNQQDQSRGLNRNSRGNIRRNDYFRTKKIFVGGLSANLTVEEFKLHFEKFGRITDVVVMQDNMTNRPRGFGFITFDSEEAVEEVMQKTFHELSGKQVEVKRAVPKEVSGPNSGGYSGPKSGGYNAPGSSGTGDYLSSYQQANSPIYGPRYDIFPSYGPFTGYGGMAGYMYGASVYGGYQNGGYSYRPLPPQVPWGPLTYGPLAYGSPSAVYPTFMNGVGGTVGLTPTGKPSQASGGNEQVVVGGAFSLSSATN